ncbi:carbohydrate-binding protein [Clostridium felsineum]|uniref:carbohydrate-binding protein n=1 Tax=Clostridium felsineum TaxID=36839 RepID=UPI00098C2652|nr:carbohydrate-binding protein [Clostridium felsineum]URZ17144.1 hypothetical protein CLFE_031960 [Clostridium felsineum DSM 794]
MKTKKIPTKFIMFMLFTAILFIFNPIAQNTSKAATVPIQLYYSQRITDDDYSIGHIEGYIAVQNLAFNKSVYVHYSLDGGKTWTDTPASYVKTNSSDNYEVWNFKTNSSSELFGPPIIYCLKYEVNGQTYWDNNNGNNYVDGAFGLSSLYTKNIKAVVNNHKYFSADVYVKNIDGAKAVKVRYSTDNWTSYTDVDVNTSNPSQSTWSIYQNVPDSTKQVQFAVLYEVNGIQYWDNNFDSNYTVNF